MSSTKKTILVIGGTGAQGAPVVKALAEGSKYNIIVTTRSNNSPTAIELSSLPGVTLLSGNVFSEIFLHTAFQGVSIAFVNTNGFAIGEKAEIYWGIRMFEIAAENHVKHFIWGGLDSAYKISGFQSRFRTGHFDGKAKVSDWISAQPTDGMKWSILTSCMYTENLGEMLAPFKEIVDGEETFVFQAPLGNGSTPLIYLEDLGRYARWMVETPERSNGLNLRVATETIQWTDLAKVFTEITGKKAVYRDLTLDEFFKSGVFPNPDAKVGHSIGSEDDTLQTYRQNFSGFWNSWKENMFVRDYDLLDEILPSRVKTVGEWMKLTGYSGEKVAVLKDYQDAMAKSKK